MAKRARSKARSETASSEANAAAPDGSAASDPSTSGPAPERVAIPGWLPAVLYGVVTLVLFRAFAFSDQMLYGTDTEGLGYMARAFYAEALKSGDFPLWNPIILGGTPFLESLAGGDSLYPPSVLLLLLLEPFRALGWKLVLHVWLAGLFSYGWTRSLGCSRAASLVAGAGFMVAPFFVSLAYPAHDGKMFVTALTPLLFWAVEAWFRNARLTALAGIGAVVAVTILTTHLQMAYFLFGATGAYALFRAIQELRAGSTAAPASSGPASAHPLARFGLFLAISIAGAGAAGVQLLPAVDYIGDASRRSTTTTQATPEENRAYASSWGMHPEEAVSSLFVPEFVGASVNEPGWTYYTYWGRNFFKYNSEYVGLGLLLLAVVSFFGGRRSGVRIFMAAMAGVAFLYTLNTWTPVWGLFYALVPGLKLFRAPSMVIFLTGFGIATLAAFGVDRVLAWTASKHPADGRTAQRVLWGAIGVFGLGMVLAQSGTLLDLWRSVLYADISGEKAQALLNASPFIAQGFLLATALCAAIAGVVWAGRGGLLKPSGVAGLLAVLVIVDGGRVSDRFLTTKDFDDFAVRGPIEDYLIEREAVEPPFRVLDLNRSSVGGGGRPPSVNAEDVRMGMWGLDLAGGHHPNDLRRYRELTGMDGGGPPFNLLFGPNVGRLLGVKYIVWPAAAGGGIEQFQFAGFPELTAITGTQLQDGRLFEVVYEAPALDRARLVGTAEIEADASTVERILDPAFDPAGTALLAPSPEAEAAVASLPGAPVDGTVEWLEEGTDRTRLRVTADSPALLVVSENHYPSWHATVDGEEAPVLRAYHTLQAVPVPAGTHEVVLQVRTSGPVRTGLFMSGGFWLLLGGLAGLERLRGGGPKPGHDSPSVG